MNTDNISKGYAYTSTMTNVRTAVYGTEQQNVVAFSFSAWIALKSFPQSPYRYSLHQDCPDG